MFRKLLTIQNISLVKYYSSALYITDNKAMDVCVVLTPYINLDKKLSQIDKLQENIKSRNSSIDLIKLKSLWEFLKNLESTKTQLEKRKYEISEHLKDLKKIDKDDEVVEEMEKLKCEVKLVKEDLKTLMTAFWEVEEKVMVNGLSLPNDLHEETPIKEDKIVAQHLDRPHVNQTRTNIEIGQDLKLLKYHNNSCVYYMNKAADMELALMYFCKHQLQQDNFIQFCNPDFARSVVVDGCATDHLNTDSVFILKERSGKIHDNFRLHLVGGASIYPFCAFHTKRSIQESNLPVKYVAVGRQYAPCNNTLPSLFYTWQSTSCQVFILANETLMDEFDKVLDRVVNIYKSLDVHFRLVYVCASDLEPWESLRASFQIYSCNEQRYIEVGYLTISDEYISHRLLMTCKVNDQDEDIKFVKVISGCVIDFSKLFGCLLEQSDGKQFSMPNCLEKFAFGF